MHAATKHAKTQADWQRCVLSFSIALILFAHGGCDRDDVLTPAPSPSSSPESRWIVDQASERSAARVALDDPQLREAMDKAIEQARATVADARKRWQATPESQRHRWAVKWAAPVAGERQAEEHLWVMPLHWSPFRVEGRLLNAPNRTLDVPGKPPEVGDLVGFPAEQISDWVRFLEEDPRGPRDGGVTIDALQRAFGSPPEANGR